MNLNKIKRELSRTRFMVSYLSKPKAEADNMNQGHDNSCHHAQIDFFNSVIMQL